MQDGTEIRSLVEGAMLAGIAVILLLSAFFLPVAGLAALLVWPVPITVLGVRHGTRYALLALVTAGLIAATLTNPLAAGILAVWLGLMGVTLGHGFRRQFSPGLTLTLGSLAVLVSILLLFAVALTVFGVNPLEAQEALLAESGALALEFYQNLGLEGAELGAVEDMVEQVQAQARLLLPAALVVSSVFFAFVVFSVSRLVLDRLGEPVPGLPPFGEWRFPWQLAGGYLLGLALSLSAEAMEWPLAREIGANLQVVFLLVLALAGLSVVYYYLERLRLPWSFRVVAVLVLVALPPLLRLAAIAGIADMVLDLRRRGRPG